MYKIENKKWCSSIVNFKPYCPPDCVAKLPEDARHHTHYTTACNDHEIDIWFSPSNETAYQQQTGGLYRIIKIHEPDGNHSHVSKYFYTWSYTTHRNLLIRVDYLLAAWFPSSK